MDILTQFIRGQNIRTSKISPFVVTVSNSEEGFSLTKSFFSHVIDRKTVLFLSGGQTPKQLYNEIVTEDVLVTGAVGLVDERYGPKMWENSNEKMLQDSGLLDYLGQQSIPFYPILEGKEMEETARDYDETVRFLFNGFQKSVGVLGIGLDGHTAGLPASARFWQAGIPIGSSKLAGSHAFVEWFSDFPGEQKERISMTFDGLSMLDYLLVLVFGKEKKEALQKMFAAGSEEEIPSRFFKRPDIAKKTLLITDQKV